MKQQCLKKARSVMLFVLCLFGLCTYAQQPAPPQNDKNRGIQLYQQSKDSEAITLLRQAAKLNPKDAEAWNYLGLTAYRLNLLPEAHEAFSKAVKLQPDDAAARSNLAFVLLLRDKDKEARREAQRALSLQSENPYAHYVLGALHYGDDLLEKALKEAEAALQSDPSFALALLLKTKVLNKRYLFETYELGEKEREARRRQLFSWAETLAVYFSQHSKARDSTIWRGALAMLSINSGFKGDFGQSPKDEVLMARDVTTKAIITAKPSPLVPDGLRAKSLVSLRVLLGADGTVWNIGVISSDNKDFLRACIRAAFGIKFTPATKGGRPVSMWIVLQYEFGY